LIGRQNCSGLCTSFVIVNAAGYAATSAVYLYDSALNVALATSHLVQCEDRKWRHDKDIHRPLREISASMLCCHLLAFQYNSV